MPRVVQGSVEQGRPGGAPSISVVVATRDRPVLLREALSAILGQDYAGDLECLVVHDRCEVDHTLEHDSPGRRVRVLSNVRSPGLPGARNSGAAVAAGEFLAFCDDDDVWMPGKLRTQVDAVQRAGADVAVTGIRVDYDGTFVDRVLGVRELTLGDFARRRVMEAHPSTFLVRRSAFDLIGPVDEQIPGGYGEDFDWIVRAAARQPIVAVPEALVRVRWHKKSYFSQRWQMIADATDYLLAKHAFLAQSRPGLAEHHGRKAFALAALGDRPGARRAATRSLRLNPLERRAHLALLVSGGAVRADSVVRWLNASGRGI